MPAPLRFTVALLAAVCLLLLAGAFPLMGAEAVYRGGAMLLPALAALAFTLWGGWRLAAGVRVRCAFGLVCLPVRGARVEFHPAVWGFRHNSFKISGTVYPHFFKKN